MLGTSASLTVPSSPGPSRVTISVSRIWTGATPIFDPGPPGGLAHALQFVHAPTRLEWLGVSFSIVNAGPQDVGVISNGRYQPYLQLVVSGKGTRTTIQADDGVAQLGFYASVAGCPNPFPAVMDALAVGATVDGCLAVPVPYGSDISTIGFVLGNESGGFPTSVALWHG